MGISNYQRIKQLMDWCENTKDQYKIVEFLSEAHAILDRLVPNTAPHDFKPDYDSTNGIRCKICREVNGHLNHIL